MGERMSLVVTLAFIFTRTELSKKLLKKKLTVKDKILLVLIFGGMGITGTYTGIVMEGGAIANSRVIGVMIAGFLGGPSVGIAAGLIAGIHRLTVGGITALACALSTVVEGTVGGLVRSRLGIENINCWVALWAGVAAEVMQMIIILAVARPFLQAWETVSVIALPMIIINSTGVAIFITILRSVFQEQEEIGATQAHKSLEIADKTLKYLKKGLNKRSAEQVVNIIYKSCDYAAVAITDHVKILAHVGMGGDHHLPGMKKLTGATKKVLTSGQIALAKNRKDIDCNNPTCPLSSAVIVPLVSKNEVIGALKLYHTSENAVNTVDTEFAKGLAHLFSNQLELAALEEQARMLHTAKIKALQAQINPHFLFNALNTIVSLIRTQPETARKLLIELGEFFNNNLKYGEDFVSMEKELDHVKSYLAIEMARFGERINVEFDVDDKCLDTKVPALLLQPLVENAIKHGILPRKKGGTVVIKAKMIRKNVVVEIEDDGVGMTKEEINKLLAKECLSSSSTGIGLSNVNERLRNLYGQEYTLHAKSTLDKGTFMRFTIPVTAQEGGNTIERVSDAAGSAG
ncbi:MAG: sensor histidine kinase [Clostridiales bacterium]|nr:sensor histidine kinase [Clostridiales bacterium]MCF8021268.1 sensor histidine kinase [Clostridiales bacterium]